ncbi:Protein DENND6B [Acropora cervicornis]|uniref:Protein DENND6B n=1 Tax=Acropora cervicornis TaxID=6130 RepID=A0AAD9Q6J3_ACRCE|nr:Protein DENND6B [Acropora cervicornis]
MAVCDEDELFLQTAFEGYVLPWDRFKRWVTCFCVVTFDLELGQALELVYPTHIELTDREKTNICYLAFPDSNSGCMGDTQFHFRIRCSPRSCQKSQFIRRCEDEVPVAYRSDPAHFYGLAYFRQVKDPSLPRGYFQKSVVLISRLPYVNLFSEVMQFVAPNFFENGELSLEAVCHDIDQWPYPEAGHTLQLPLMGNVLQPQMPSPKVIPTLKDPDIFRCLQPILPHIHLLWELVLTNEPIVVMAPSPTVCSETVQALASLISPLHYCSDFRPFFTIHDTEFKEYTTRTQAPPGVILGVTNPFFAKTLQHWPHMVRIGEMANLVVTSRRSPVIGHNPKKTLSSKPGIYTKYKQLLAKDKLIFRRLSKGNHPKRPPEVQNAILRRHMVELTQSFMIPLERYVASLMPLQKSISPWKRPPRLRPFDAEEFLTTLEHSGPQLTSRLKGNWVALYRKFFKSANFEGWLRQRRQEIRQKLELLHLEALGKADVSLWIKDKQEVEIVDLFLRIKEKLAGSVSFYPPVGHDVKQQLKAHLTTITNNLPVDLQFVLKNS